MVDALFGPIERTPAGTAGGASKRHLASVHARRAIERAVERARRP
jgi:hypothetical protein